MISDAEFKSAVASVFAEHSIAPGALLGLEALRALACHCTFDSVLDVGAGHGVHASILRRLGKQVLTVDFHSQSTMRQQTIEAADLIGDYLSMRFAGPFDAVWCCHVLEHQRNAGVFLEKLLDDLKEGGTLAITVPPFKHNIVGGHLSVWNAGLLLYNLVLAGNDCSQAMVRRYGYNISVLTPRKPASLPADLVGGRGDLERLAQFFPLEAAQDFDGDIEELNWPISNKLA